MTFTDWHTYQREKREADADRAAVPVSTGPVVPHCLKCGWPVDLSKHYGRVWTFDHGTDELHVCRTHYRSALARMRRDSFNERYRGE